MFIPQNDIIDCKRQEPEKTATVKVTVVLLCSSISVLSHEHALNACYWRYANLASVTVEVAMAGEVELTTGSWLLASMSLSLSSSDVTWKASA